MELKQFVLDNVLPDTYYQARFSEWNSKSRPNVLCPFHEETKPSCSVGLKSGGARCHSCGCSIGNIVHFESKANNISEELATLQIYAEFIRPIIALEDTDERHNSLLGTSTLLRTIEQDTGISLSTIKKFRLGWDAVARRMSIPIFDRWGNVVNERLYLLPSQRRLAASVPKLINRKGYGTTDLFPWPSFLDYNLSKPIFVMASEKEAMLGIQSGMQCVCATAGEMSWPDEWAELFTGYDVIIVGQNDDAGNKAAEKKLVSLQKFSLSCRVTYPPEPHKDFADWLLAGGNPLTLLAQAADEKKAAIPSSPSFSEQAAPILPKSFSDEVQELASIGARTDMLNLLVKTRGIVAAKSTLTYTIPWKFKVKVKKDAQRFFTLEVGRHLLSFVKASDTAIKATVRELLGQEETQVEAEDFLTVTEVEVIPMAAVDKDVIYVTQRCYFVGGRIEANVPYEFEIIPTNAVGTQETIGIIVKATPVSRAVETRTFSEEDFVTLQVFQPAEEESVYDKMLALAETVSKHYSKIYNRPDWHLVALLTWISPIGFAFPFEKEMQRGWLNSLAVGDTQTGKSKVVQTLQKLFNAGTIINAENCTYVGLVGGAVKMGSGQFMLRWGRIPLSDKQLVVIEELSGLSVEEISHMSDVRSSGVARLDKGGLSAETNARTRLLCLSNVRPVNKNLAGYLSGVQAIRELIGHGEDIARFDLICTLVDHEVSVEVINRPFSSKGLKEAIPEVNFEKLCQFVWALKPDQIKITTDAYYTILDETKRLSDIYHASVPIFKGGSGRYKIARIAASIACLQFNWSGRAILVTEDHVEAACKFLEALYNKQSFGYLEWSKQMSDRDEVKNVQLLVEKFEERLPTKSKRDAVLETLIHSAKFNRDELCSVASLSITHADDLIGVMVRERVLRKGEANVWEITPAGHSWMKQQINGIHK